MLISNHPTVIIEIDCDIDNKILELYNATNQDAARVPLGSFKPDLDEPDLYITWYSTNHGGSAKLTFKSMTNSSAISTSYLPSQDSITVTSGESHSFKIQYGPGTDVLTLPGGSPSPLTAEPECPFVVWKASQGVAGAAAGPKVILCPKPQTGPSGGPNKKVKAAAPKPKPKPKRKGR
jgi:hypothetical protein